MESTKIYDMESAARRLGISKQTLYRLTSQKLIAHYKPSIGRIVFSEEQLSKYLELHVEPAIK